MSGSHWRWHQHHWHSPRGTTTTRVPLITTREVQMRGGKAANNISPGSHIRSTCACQHDVHTYFKTGKNLWQRNGGPGSLGCGQTFNVAQCPGAFHKPFHEWKTKDKGAGTEGEVREVYSPTIWSSCSRMNSKVWTDMSLGSCYMVVLQEEVPEWGHCQRHLYEVHSEGKTTVKNLEWVQIKRR